MKKIIYIFIFFFSLINTKIMAQENVMILKLTYGDVEMELYNSNFVVVFSGWG